MIMSSSVLRYHPLLRLIHWLMAILVVAMIGTGFMLEEKPVVAGYPIIFWHQSFGLSIFALIWLRLIVRWSFPLPTAVASLSDWEKRLSRVVHTLFYIFMVIVPITGYLAIVGNGASPQWFGLTLPFPDMTATIKQLSNTHALLAFCLIGLVGLHLLAFVKHRLVGKINLLQRM